MQKGDHSATLCIDLGGELFQRGREPHIVQLQFPGQHAVIWQSFAPASYILKKDSGQVMVK